MLKTTTISFDEEIKALAEKKAKSQNMSLSSVARILIKDYALWNIEIWARAKMNNDYSPDFTDMQKALSWLNSSDAEKFIKD